jgi:N-acylglucosamine-6-phosphate 2-epimerase
MSKHDFFERIHHHLIVSCQALENEPLHGSETMAKMAQAAKEGGAVAIRSNSPEDIFAIKHKTQLPVIGLLKKVYPDNEVFITPTKKEVDELLAVQPEVIALDATIRERPNKESLQDIVHYIHNKSSTLVMGDISDLGDAEYATKCGVDMLSTTLSGYTSYSPQQVDPDFELVKTLSQQATIPVIAEGRIQTPDQAQKMFELGAWSIVVGGAITRPQLITKSFIDKINMK